MMRTRQNLISQQKQKYPTSISKPTTLKQSNINRTNEQKLFEECMKILKQESIEQNNKWLIQNKINSYSLRNDKAGDIVNTMNYIFQKVLVAGNENKEYDDNYLMLKYLLNHYKSSSKKIIQFCHLIKHFSLWDYQFQFYFCVFLGQELNNINLYLTCRNYIIQSSVNKYKKAVLSGVQAQIQQWSKLAQNIFKSYDQRTLVEQFVEVVKYHYIEVKKNQNQRINGAEFFKICQIMNQRLLIQHQNQMSENSGRTMSKPTRQKSQPTLGEVFKQTLLNGLTMEDRQLVRILSCKDKNIARLLQEKHNKMVNIIGQEVDSLRKDIEIQKRKYLQVIEQKKGLVNLIERIKRKTLQYVVDNNVKNEQEVLQIFEQYNKKYNPHSLDIEKCRKEIENKRLLEVIEEQEKML